MRKFVTIAVLLVSSFLFSSGLMAQGGKTKRVNNYGLQMSFKKDRTEVKSIGGLTRNVLQVINYTDKKAVTELNVSAPAGWTLYSKNNFELTLKPHDTVYVPVRLHPYKTAKGGENFVVNAFLTHNNFTITNAMWYITIEKKTDWRVTTSSNKIYFLESSDSVKYQLSFSNYGNSDEFLKVQCDPGKYLYFIDEEGESVNHKTRKIELRRGQDTVLNYIVKRFIQDEKPETTGKHLRSSSFKDYRINLIVTQENQQAKSRKRWAGSIILKKVPSTKKVHESGFNSMPLTVEFNTYNLLSQNTNSSLNLYGSHYFANRSNLTYYYQSDFIQNQLEAKSFLGNYHYLSYIHQKFGVSVGDLGAGYSGSTLSGKGIKAYVNIKNHKIGALYVRKPKFFQDYYGSGFGAFYKFTKARTNFDVFIQHSENEIQKLKTNLGIANLGFSLLRKHNFRFSAGYSQEERSYNPTSPLDLTGYGGRFSYQLNLKKLNFGINSFFGSKDYLALRGTQSLGSRLNYRINKKHSLGASALYYVYNPNLWSRGKLNDTLFNNRLKLDIKYAYTTNKYAVLFQPSVYNIKSTGLDSRTSGAALEFRKRDRTSLAKFYTILFAGYTFFPEHKDVGNIFVANVRSVFRYKNFQTSMRYYYGPYYSIDQALYIRTQENPQKLYTNMYYDFWLLNNQVRLNANLNYNYNIIAQRHQLNTRPEVFYYTKSGFQISAYARYILYSEGESSRISYSIGSQTPVEEIIEANSSHSFEVGMGVKFNINVPIGISRYYPVKVIAFQDVNGNGMKEPNEEGISSMLISLKANDNGVADDRIDGGSTVAKIHDLVTNTNGQVEFFNVGVGNYEISIVPLSSLGGWFDGKSFSRTIDKKSTIYIPLSKGARLSGGVILERANFGRGKEIRLGNIRVTAMNIENGKSFVTLTTSDGQFAMYVPNGQYELVINETAIDEGFQFMQNNIPLTVTEEYDNYNVSFYLAENERSARVGRAPRKPNLPITRNQDKDANGSSAGQRTQLDDPAYLPVVEPSELGKYWVVQLYPNSQARHKKELHDTLRNITDVRCIVGEGSGFLYISSSYRKKRNAKVLRKEILKRGYSEAQIVEMMFGSSVKPDTKVKETEESVKDSTVHIVRPYTETPKADSTKTEPKVETPKKDKPEIEKTDKAEPFPGAIYELTTVEERNFFRIEVKASVEQLNAASFQDIFPATEVIYEIQQDGLFKYSIGQFSNYSDAKAYQQQLRSTYKLPGSFITQYKKSW